MLEGPAGFRHLRFFFEPQQPLSSTTPDESAAKLLSALQRSRRNSRAEILSQRTSAVISD